MDINSISEFIIEHCKQYPALEITDMLKALYQSSFGCGHMISSKAYDYLLEELNLTAISDDTFTPLPGNFTRTPLSFLKKSGMSSDTFFKLFLLSSNAPCEQSEHLEKKLNILLTLTERKQTPFNYNKLEEAIEKWRKNGFPLMRHSDSFRRHYAPSYRIICNDYIPFLDLFALIDKLCATGKHVLVAIEGGSASGKTTLSELISKVYDCNVFHVDDFFLRPEQRTPERLAEAGGNFDRERFIKDVLIPLSKGSTVMYEKYDCSSQNLLPATPYACKKLNIIEGAYSMHPDMSHLYNLSVFLDIDKNTQKERITRRNAPFLQEKFFNEWIPMEDLYFNTFNIPEKCNIRITIKSGENN